MAKLIGRCISEKKKKMEISDTFVDNHQLHVLAVDDSFVDRKLIERLLKISSCEVTVVENGQRALQFLGLDQEKKKKKSSLESNGLKVHLIITDYSMPGMTGYELLKRIKESSMFKEVPVVIMSSENILGRIARCLEEGAKEYIVKPLKLTDVKRLKDFIKTSEFNGIKGNENFKLSIPEIQNPVVVGNSCSSPESFCISKHSRFTTRSSKHHSRVSPQRHVFRDTLDMKCRKDIFMCE